MAEQVTQRNPDGMKKVILLMDGQDSLWLLAADETRA
jgi:hypothetical protein